MAAAPHDITFSVRRSDPDDIDTIKAMFERSFVDEASREAFALFHGLEPGTCLTTGGRHKVFVSLIETCLMSVTVEDDEGNIAGYASMDDGPIQMTNYEENGTDWESWFQATHRIPQIDSTNTLWFACCLTDPEPGVMGEILRTIFSTMQELQHVLVFVPSGIREDHRMELLMPFQAHFLQLQAHGSDSTLGSGHWAAPSADGTRALVLHCSRESVIVPLHIRMARVEDHDNLVAVFDAQSEVVTEVYGEFFIAELIEAQNEENRALVAEVDGRAVGLMCLTSDVDVNVLSQCFQLDPYDNLLKPHYMRRVREYSKAVQEGQETTPLFSHGDLMQVALGSINVDTLIGSLPKHEVPVAREDGVAATKEQKEAKELRLSGAQLISALQTQEFADEIGDFLKDFDRGMLSLMWQAHFQEQMLEPAGFVDPKKVSDAAHIFMELNVEKRRCIAQAVLDEWPRVEEILTQVKEALLGGGEDEERKKLDQDGLDKEAADDDLRQDSEMEQAPDVETVVFLQALMSVRENEGGLFTQDFLVQLAMVLHWWGDAELGSPMSIVPEDGFKSALEQVLTAEEGLFVGNPGSPSWLSNMPQHAKDVFCVNVFCLDQAFMTQALDLLLPAFSLYPEKDYCIITQPHSAPNTPLLNAFTIVPPQPQNTFGHVLYLIHRASLLGPPKVFHLTTEHLEQVFPLIESFDDAVQQDIQGRCHTYLRAVASKSETSMQAFVADFDDQVVGLLILEVPTPDVVDTLRCCYHLDDYLLVEHHEQRPNKGHARLAHWVVNPIFQKFTRRLLQGALRLCGRTVLFSELELLSTVPPIFREMLQVAPRRPPQLKKVMRKPPKVASFVNVEKPVPSDDDLREAERQAQLRDATQTKALSIVAKKLLSETKIPVNSRIVVVGASDCGLSFLESLLSMPHLHFNSLTLLAPGALEYHHAHHLPLVAGTAAYSHQELRRIMLELRVRILDSRMCQIDRQQRCCILHDGSVLPYDYLVVTAGLQDEALNSLKIRSWGVSHVADGFRQVNGAMSAADPFIRDLLVEGGTLVKSLIWNPLSFAVVYGRSLHAYCVAQGLLLRKVPPTKIIMVLPPRMEDDATQLPVDAFYEGDEVEDKIHSILEAKGIKVHENYRILGIQQDNRQRLKALILEDCNDRYEGDELAPKPEPTTNNRVQNGIMQDFGTTAAGDPQKLLTCRIVITADAVNVDPDIFNSVHGNGLVYDGRLIVDHNFKTTDPAIFGAGSLCEFSRRFQRKNAARYLRHDGFNGREVGAKLAQALLKVLDPVNGDVLAAGASSRSSRAPTVSQGPDASLQGMSEMEGLISEDSSPDLLPDFYMPTAKGGLLPGNLHYYRIKACRRGDQGETTEVKQEQVIVTDTLDASNGTGHFCRLTMDNFGKVDSITYLGGEELQVESLWSLVGLSETFLNHLYARWRDGDIPDIVEFFADDWATALFHDRFMDFCHQIKMEMYSKDEVKQIIDDTLDCVDLHHGLSREILAKIRSQLPRETVKQMQDHVLDYLRENTNHLKTYFLPENWAK